MVAPDEAVSPMTPDATPAEPAREPALLPCRFCGRRADRFTNLDNGNLHIFCPKACAGVAQQPAEAVAAWNQIHAPAPAVVAPMATPEGMMSDGEWLTQLRLLRLDPTDHRIDSILRADRAARRAECDRLRALAGRAAEFIAKAHADHRYCEDGWYGCPKNPESFGSEGADCNCWKPQADLLLSDLRAVGGGR